MPPPIIFKATFCATVSHFSALYSCWHYLQKKKKMCLGHLVLLTELSDIFRGVKIPEKLGGDIALGLFSFVLQFPTIFGKPKYN